MTRPDLDELLKSHYDAQEMDPSARDELVNRIKKQGRAPWPLKRIALGLAAGVAAAMVVVLGGLLAFNLAPPSDPGAAIASEVVENHLRDLPADREVDSFAAASEVLTKLDFGLRRPTGLIPQGARIEGVRYCTIQGRIAAQIRLRGPDGALLTLYQARADERWQGLDGQALATAGIPVVFSVSDGLISVLAGASDGR